MNGRTTNTNKPVSRAMRRVSALLLALMLCSHSLPATAGAAMEAQAATTSEQAAIDEAKTSIPADASSADSNETNPDSGTLALLALGLIALGLARKKVRN